jgi:hypothetical protein
MAKPMGDDSLQKEASDHASQPFNGAAAVPHWKAHLDLYRDQRALTFKDDAHLDAAVDLLWTEPLRDLPHALAGGDTIIVPAEAVRYFRDRGLQFRSTKVLSAGDLPATEIDKLRREQGPY